MTQPAFPTAYLRRRLLPEGWAPSALFLLFPMWWLLGLGALIWPIIAVPMAARLGRLPRLHVPPGFAIWMLFIVWMLASVTHLDDGSQLIPFVYRAGNYVSATILLLYLYNVTLQSRPVEKVVNLLAVFWVITVLGGLFALIVPNLSFTSVTEMLLPGALKGQPFVRTLVHPRVAQISTILGYGTPRPTAPFVYTNDWGSNLALLTPFYLFWLASSPSRRLTIAGRVLLVVALVPAVVSLNRGLWLSLGAGLAYATVRFLLRGKVKGLQVVAVLLVVVATLYYMTPLGTVVQDRVATPHSNEERTSLYEDAVRRTAESPLLGFGSTRDQEGGEGRPVGTHGQLWMVLFSHGIPGAAFFVAWLLWTLVRTSTSRMSVMFACHLCVVMAVVQLPYYGWLPVQMHVIMAAAAIGLHAAGHEKQPVGSQLVSAAAQS